MEEVAGLCGVAFASFPRSLLHLVSLDTHIVKCEGHVWIYIWHLGYH